MKSQFSIRYLQCKYTGREAVKLSPSGAEESDADRQADSGKLVIVALGALTSLKTARYCFCGGACVPNGKDQGLKKRSKLLCEVPDLR